MPVTVRRATGADQDALVSLREAVVASKGLKTTTLASSKELLYLLDTQFLSLVVCESGDAESGEPSSSEIVAYCALEACPAINAYKVKDMVAADQWLTKMEAAAEQNVTLSNSLWINDHIGLTAELVEEVCHFVYSQPRLCVEHLFAVERASQPKSLFSPDNHFEPVAGAETFAVWINRARRSSDCVRVLKTHKKAFIQPLRIRMARGEDHDSLVAVFDSQSDVVTETYGEFFLAELMESQNEENKAIVAEADGRALGLCCLTSDVDVNVLAQCFELLPYDNLLKSKYWNKVSAQMKKEMAVAEDDSTFSHGDYLQAALQGMDLDVFVSNIILLQAEDHEEPEGVTAMQMLNALRTQEFGDRYNRAEIDIAEAILIGMWHQMWWTPRIEAHTFLRFEELSRLAKRIDRYDIKTRRAIAGNVLSKWDKIFDTFWAVKEAADQAESEKRDIEAVDKKKRAKAVNRDQLENDGEISPDNKQDALDSYDINVPRTERTLVPRVQFGKLLYQLTTSIEDAQREQRRGSVIKKGSKEKKQKDYQELLDPKNITDPDVKTPPPLTREEATDLLFIVHWWGNLGCVSAIDSVDSESMKKALEAIVAKEDDIFISHHQSPSWLFGVPDVMKDFFCVNLFCVDESIAHRSADFLLPAFALFPDKDYCVITQPHTSQITPFLQAFSIVPPKPSNTFGHVLFVLHRACCTNAISPTVRMLDGEEDMDALATMIEGMPSTDGEDVFNTLDAALQDDDAQCFVVEFDSQVIGVVGFSNAESDYLGTLRCVYHIDRALVYPDYNSFAFVDFFLVNPIFNIYKRKILHLCQLLGGATVLLYEARLTPKSGRPELVDGAPGVLLSPGSESPAGRNSSPTLAGGRQTSQDVPALPGGSHAHGADASLGASGVLRAGLSKKELTELKKQEQRQAELEAEAARKEEASLERQTFKKATDAAGNLLPLSTVVREMTQVPPRNPPCLLVGGGRSAGSARERAATFASLPVEPTPQAVEAERREKMMKRALKNGLSLLARPRLSAPKLAINARIVVVGASHTGLSFLLSLLLPAYDHLQFNSLTLVAPELKPMSGGKSLRPLNELDEHLLRRLKADVRVRVLRDRVREIDRGQKALVLESEKSSLLPYDYLVLTPGLQDCTLSRDGIQLRSYGFNRTAIWQIETSDIKARALQRKKEAAVREKEEAEKKEKRNPRSASRDRRAETREDSGAAAENTEEGTTSEEQRLLEESRPVINPDEEPSTLNGVLSVGDPRLADFFAESGTFVKGLIWNPLTVICVYGNSLDVYTIIQGLLLRKVPANKIVLVQPPTAGDTQAQLREKEIQIFKGHELVRLEKDGRDRLSGVVCANHSADAPAGEKGKEVVFTCRILLTADAVDVDPDIFNALHSNGLVFDGGLIVDNTFQTTDSNIFAAGPLAEFSRSAQSTYVQDRSLLRHDGYNGLELAKHLARAILEKVLETEPAPFSYKDLSMPIFRAGVLPGNLKYYQVICPHAAKLTCKQMLTDTLTSDTGHLCLLRYSGCRITEFLYLGYQELHRHALFHLVGRHIAFLNGIEQRFDGEMDLMEFLTDPWTSAFYHDDFFERFIAKLKKSAGVGEGGNLGQTEEGVQTELLGYLKDCRELSKIKSYFLPGDPTEN
eukprot:g5452.t1